jgi:hypothetical protein
MHQTVALDAHGALDIAHVKFDIEELRDPAEISRDATFRALVATPAGTTLSSQ